MLHNWHLVAVRFLADSLTMDVQRDFFFDSISLWWDRFCVWMCVCACVFFVFGWRMANFVGNFIEWENERVCVCVCLVSPSALTLFEWLLVLSYWLVHIKCVLMRDDIALFHLKQNQRNNFSLSLLLFCCQFFSLLRHFILRGFFGFRLSLSLSFFFNFICLRVYG